MEIGLVLGVGREGLRDEICAHDCLENGKSFLWSTFGEADWWILFQTEVQTLHGPLSVALLGCPESRRYN